MGKFAEAAAPAIAPKRCRAGDALHDLLEDDEDTAAYESMVAERKWTALARLTGLTDKTMRVHATGECCCG